MSDSAYAVMECKPVFVVGMNGSGTTMLADSLGLHPQLYMFPHEVRLLPYLIHQASRFGDMSEIENRRRLAGELWRSKPFWHVRRRVDAALPDECVVRPGLAQTIDGVFMHFARQAGKSRWGEKSPMNVLHMDALAAVFPHARFVHIMRDGRDAAQSFHRRFGFVPQETIYRWKKAVTRGRDTGARLGPKHYLEVRYEDLTADPESWMRRICGFLELPFDPVVLGSTMRMAPPSMKGENMRILRNSGKWEAYFSDDISNQLENIAGHTLAELGYPVNVRGDDNPGLTKLRVWRALGIVRRTRIQFRTYGKRGLKGFIKSAVVSFKQGRVNRV